MSKNKYLCPINIECRICYKDSPAHINKLEHAIDFIVPENTKIKASANGIVVDVKQNSDVSGKEEKYDKHGNYIEIKHKNNEYSIYEHIRKNGSLVKIGDKVKADQIIGYSGRTGWIAHLGPHLHFDVHKYINKKTNDYKSIKITWKKT